MKNCKHCNIELNENVKHEGFQCKTCRNGLARYGMNRQQQIDMLESQNGQCKICKNDIELFTGRLGGNPKACVVDHSHDTGEVRGILCSPCNTAIGVIEKVGKEAFLSNVTNFLMPS